MNLCIIENSKIINVSGLWENCMLDYYWCNIKVPPKLWLYNLKTVSYEFIQKRGKAITAFRCSNLCDLNY